VCKLRLSVFCCLSFKHGDECSIPLISGFNSSCILLLFCLRYALEELEALILLFKLFPLREASWLILSCAGLISWGVNGLHIEIPDSRKVLNLMCYVSSSKLPFVF
jgi:hypothetical protein